MPETTLISIVVPAFNHESFVKQALDSTLGSGLPEVELILCDDASSDSTPEIIRQWIRLHKDSFVRCEFIEHKKNVGLPASMSEITAEARGEIIHCLASDDFYLPGGLAAKTRAMEANRQWMGAFCDGKAVAADNSVYCDSLMAASGMDVTRLNAENMASELFHHWREPANLLSWRRKAFKTHGGEFDYDRTVFCEDFDFAWWAMSRQVLGYVPDVCFAYRCRSWPQTSNRDLIKEWRDLAHILAKHAQFFPPDLRTAMRVRAAGYFHLAAGDHSLAASFLQAAQAWRPSSPVPADERDNSANPSDVWTKYAQNVADVLLGRKEPGSSLSAASATEDLQLALNKSLHISKANSLRSGQKVQRLEVELQTARAEVRSKSDSLKDIKQDLRSALQQVKKLKNQLNHHAASPVRALKLWWRQGKTES